MSRRFPAIVGSRLRCLAGAALTSTLAFGVGASLARGPAFAARRGEVGAQRVFRSDPATAGARQDQASCADRVHDRLFFGLRTPDGVVSDADWTRFLADTVTPLFPDGLTVVNATGQWRGAGDRAVTVEPSRVVEITHGDSPEANRNIKDIVRAYKRRFRQDSVMRTRARMEACF